MLKINMFIEQEWIFWCAENSRTCTHCRSEQHTLCTVHKYEQWHTLQMPAFVESFWISRCNSNWMDRTLWLWITCQRYFSFSDHQKHSLVWQWFSFSRLFTWTTCNCWWCCNSQLIKRVTSQVRTFPQFELWKTWKLVNFKFCCCYLRDWMKRTHTSTEVLWMMFLW